MADGVRVAVFIIAPSIEGLSADHLLLGMVVGRFTAVGVDTGRTWPAKRTRSGMAGDGVQQGFAELPASIALQGARKAFRHQIEGQLGLGGHAQQVAVEPIFVISIELAEIVHINPITGMNQDGYKKNPNRILTRRSLTLNKLGLFFLT
jgi:hypothetical protein